MTLAAAGDRFDWRRHAWAVDELTMFTDSNGVAVFTSGVPGGERSRVQCRMTGYVPIMQSMDRGMAEVQLWLQRSRGMVELRLLNQDSQSIRGLGWEVALGMPLICAATVSGGVALLPEELVIAGQVAITSTDSTHWVSELAVDGDQFIVINDSSLWVAIPPIPIDLEVATVAGMSGGRTYPSPESLEWTPIRQSPRAQEVILEGGWRGGQEGTRLVARVQKTASLLGGWPLGSAQEGLITELSNLRRVELRYSWNSECAGGIIQYKSVVPLGMNTVWGNGELVPSPNGDSVWLKPGNYSWRYLHLGGTCGLGETVVSDSNDQILSFSINCARERMRINLSGERSGSLGSIRMRAVAATGVFYDTVMTDHAGSAELWVANGKCDLVIDKVQQLEGDVWTLHPERRIALDVKGPVDRDLVYAEGQLEVRCSPTNLLFGVEGSELLVEGVGSAQPSLLWRGKLSELAGKRILIPPGRAIIRVQRRGRMLAEAETSVSALRTNEIEVPDHEGIVLRLLLTQIHGQSVPATIKISSTADGSVIHEQHIRAVKHTREASQEVESEWVWYTNHRSVLFEVFQEVAGEAPRLHYSESFETDHADLFERHLTL